MARNDIIPFGPYTWQVLAVEDGQRALLITQDIVELRWYHDKFEPITWADCTLRPYLNDALYSTFSPDQQARIIAVTNKNANNPWFNTPGGQNTIDHLFLLSLDEVSHYLGDSRTNLAHKGPQRWHIDDANNSQRQARYGPDVHGWRLRSPGYYGRTSASISKQGHIYVRGNGVFGRPRDGGGVRPALWLRVEDPFLPG